MSVDRIDACFARLRKGTALLLLGLSACSSPAPAPPAAADTAATSIPAPVPTRADTPVAATPAPVADTAPGPAENTSALEPVADRKHLPPVVQVGLAYAGKVRIGQRMAELQTQGRWTSRGMIEDLGPGCEYYHGGSLSADIDMMVLDDRVARFDIGPLDGGTISQPGPYGLRIGMARAQAVALLPGQPTSSPHVYGGDEDEYLTWREPGTDRAIRLEMYEGTVSVMYWGTREAIELAEGCA